MTSPSSTPPPEGHDVETPRSAGYVREETLGVLAHDLRAPLASITSAVGLLLAQGGMTAGQLKAVKHIATSANRMARMVADLLDLTQAHLARGLPITPRPADFNTACLQAIEELGVAHADRTIVFGAQGDCRGLWDTDRLTQVVSNLVGNALAYGPPELPVRVTLQGAGDAVVLTVHNRGPAIPAERMTTLFEPFRPTGPLSEVERASKGLGLGLYIVHAIVRAHGGTVTAQSATASGTTFTVTLPRANPAPGPATATPAA